MSFGTKASKSNTPKKKLDVNKDVKNEDVKNKDIKNKDIKNKDVKNEEPINECNNSNSIHNIRDNNDISNVNTRSNKVNKTDFLKHIKKNKKSSDILLFGLSKEEKLQLFIDNLKLLHSGIPDFWLDKEISEFKKKFNIL